MIRSFIGDLYEKKPIIMLNLLRQEFIRLIKKWEVLGRAGTKEITVLWDGKNVEVTGKNVFGVGETSK